MTTRAAVLTCAALTLCLSGPLHAHGCEPDGESNRYLTGGHYHGDCAKDSELAHGHGRAKAADSYVGDWVQGKPSGKGVYAWENGARLEGSFKDGIADGPGVYFSAKGTRYEGPFRNGKATGIKPGDCPATPGPLNC